MTMINPDGARDSARLRVRRFWHDHIESAKLHLSLVHDYARNAFGENHDNRYLGELAAKLRLLFSSHGSNDAILVRLCNIHRREFMVTVTQPVPTPATKLGGIPVRAIRLQEYLDAKNIYLAGIELSPRMVIHMWAEQAGAAHDDPIFDLGLFELMYGPSFKVHVFGLSIGEMVLRDICGVLVRPAEALIAEFEKAPDFELIAEYNIKVCRDNIESLPLVNRHHLIYTRQFLFLLAGNFPNRLLKAAQNAQQSYPEDPIVLFMHGFALHRKNTTGAIEEAERILSKALRQAKNDGDSIKYCAYERACVLCKLGQLGEAEAMLVLSIQAAGREMLEQALRDQDLLPLRQSPSWERIVTTEHQPQEFLNKIKEFSFDLVPPAPAPRADDQRQSL
jgi:tetratricopeptide (TPR) repeat protein